MSFRQWCLIILSLAVVGCRRPAPMGPVELSEVLDLRYRASSAPLRQGYRGQLQIVHRAGDAQSREPDIPQVLEFTHVWFGDRGIGGEHRPKLTIASEIADPNAPSGGSFTNLATYLPSLPTAETLSRFSKVEEFREVFGEFRGLTDLDGDLQRGWRMPVHWTGFSMLRDKSIRVVSVFLILRDYHGKTSITSVEISEGLFRPTGAPPRPTQR